MGFNVNYGFRQNDYPKFFRQSEIAFSGEGNKLVKRKINSLSSAELGRYRREHRKEAARPLLTNPTEAGSSQVTSAELEQYKKENPLAEAQTSLDASWQMPAGDSFIDRKTVLSPFYLATAIGSPQHLEVIHETQPRRKPQKAPTFVSSGLSRATTSGIRKEQQAETKWENQKKKGF